MGIKLDILKTLIGKREEKRVGLVVDGPNLIRKDFKVDIGKIRQLAEKHGHMTAGKVLLNQFASEKLIEAVANQGMEPVITVGDVDVLLATEVMEMVFNPNIDIIAVASRDTDFVPAVLRAKKHGKITVAIGVDTAFGVALKNSVDYLELIEK